MHDAEVPPLPRPTDPLASSRTGPWTDRIHELIARARLSMVASAIAPGTIACIVVLVIGVFAWTRFAGSNPPPLETELPMLDLATIDASAPVDPVAAANVDAANTAGSASQTVTVHVAGAVARPGVHALVEGSRIVDALDAAGGAKRTADLDRINLAAPLVDGSQILVPRIGDPAGPVLSTGTGDDTDTLEGPVNINTASDTVLQTLPGVGPATAAAIIAHREEHGPFTSITALDDVSGIGPARLEQLRDLVTIAR